MGILTEHDRIQHLYEVEAARAVQEAFKARQAQDDAELAQALIDSREALVDDLVARLRLNYRAGKPATAYVTIAFERNSIPVYAALCTLFGRLDSQACDQQITLINERLHALDEEYCISYRWTTEDIIEKGIPVNGYVSGVIFTIQPETVGEKS